MPNDPIHIHHSEVLAFCDYDPETGIVRRLEPSSGRRGAVGDEMGYPSGGGMEVRFLGHRVRLHRLIWFYMTGCWPNGVSDHKNRNPMDNRWSNLREATQAQNRRNNSLPTHNTSGHLGVCRDRYKRKWRAQIVINDKTVHIGTYETKEQAIEARRVYAANVWGEFAPAEVSHT